MVLRYVTNFHLLKIHRFANELATTGTREKIWTDLESLEFGGNFDVGLTKFRINQILLNQTGGRFLMTAKLIYRVKHPH